MARTSQNAAKLDLPPFLEILVDDLLWFLEYQNLSTSEEPLRGWLEELDAKELYQLSCQVRLSIVEIGASASQADLHHHCDVILDALVRTDCGFRWTGREPPIVPSAGGAISEASYLWAHARRRDLERRPDQDVGEECRKVLHAQTESAARLRNVVTQTQEPIISKMRDLAAKRHKYSRAFVEAGHQLRKLNVPPKRACEHLRKTPIEAPGGLTITADPENRRILVMRDGEKLTSKSEDQFRKRDMKFSASGRRRKV
jgi:hypothetical protein